MYHTHTLANGMTILGAELPAFRSVAFQFVTDLGSARDPVGRFGLSALVNETLYRGADGLGCREILEAFDELGAEQGGTTLSSRNVMGSAILPQNLHPALELYARLLRSPQLSDVAVDAEKQMFLQEILGEEDLPESRLQRRLDVACFGHAWGHVPHGTPESLAEIQPDDVRAHRDTFLRPNGTILLLAGNFDWDATLRTVRRLFGDWEPRQVASWPELATDWRSFHLPLPTQQTHFALAWETLPYAHPDEQKVRVGEWVLGQCMNSRLFNELREDRGLCYSVELLCAQVHGRRMAMCVAAAEDDHAREALRLMLREIQKLAEGITPDELQAYKVHRKTDTLMAQELCGSYLSAMFTDWQYHGRLRCDEEYLREIEELRLEEINAVLATRSASRFILGSVGKPRENPYVLGSGVFSHSGAEDAGL